jgi:Helicase HerA, central domain
MRHPPARRVIDDRGEVLTHSGWLALAPWLAPWAGAVALFPLGGAGYVMWGRDPQAAPWAAVGLALAVVALATLAYRAGRARGPIVRAGVAAGVACAGAWLLAATLTGPWTRPTRDLWVFLLIVGPCSANLVRLLRGDGQDGNGGWAKLGDAVKLPGSRVLSARRDGERIHAVVEGAPGTTQDEIMAAGPRIASATGAPAGGVRLVADPDHGRRANLTLVTRDLLKAPIVWPGPSARGASIAEALLLGVREDGSPLRLWLPGDEQAGRAATHVLVTGMTGSGKSVTARLIVTEALTRSDCEVTIIDTVKGAQFVAPFRRLSKCTVVTSGDAAKAFLASLPALIADRAEQLGSRGYDQWAAGCGLPYRLVLIEEAAAGLGTSRALAVASQTARSVGVGLVVSLQRATHQNLSTDVRAQMATVLAHGCRPGDERYGLSAETVDSGAAPQRWGATRPGYVYGEIVGTPSESWSSPARVFIAGIGAVTAELGHAGVQVDTDPPPFEAQRGSQAVSAGDTARDLFLSHVDLLRGDGRAEIRPRDFASVRETLGYSAAWVTAELARLVDQGELEPAGARGVYRFTSAGTPLAPARVGGSREA